MYDLLACYTAADPLNASFLEALPRVLLETLGSYEPAHPRKLGPSHAVKFLWPTWPCSRFILCFFMLPLMCLLFLISGWTDLPQLALIDGTSNKLRKCAACHLPISLQLRQICCRFTLQGFPLTWGLAQPCRTHYHMDCYCVGFPFKTRLPADGGITGPSRIRKWPHFICEACTVRSMVDREL
jgi:hypothetical protein